MGFERFGDGVERVVDTPFEAERRGLDAVVGEEVAAEGVAGEEAVEIGAPDTAVRRGGAVGRAVDPEDGARAVRAGGAAEMDFVARGFDAMAE